MLRSGPESRARYCYKTKKAILNWKNMQKGRLLNISRYQYNMYSLNVYMGNN